MKIILQRVKSAQVNVNQVTIGSIDQGLLLLVGFGKDDEPDTPLAISEKISRAIDKILHLRVFPNDQGKLDYSLVDVGGSILAVPQFTLYGRTQKGRRPDFTQALSPDIAEQNFDQFIRQLTAQYDHLATGQFGADMEVSLINDGPFTLDMSF